jgi:disease resistance protein RPS2
MSHVGCLGLTEPPKDEDWKNAKNIYLMDNELSDLPKNPRCPVLSTLFLQRNHKLRTIPPSFFDNMPVLQILNLSRTGIRYLLESIVRLVNLKRLFLNDCHCFMILSPKVGKLNGRTKNSTRQLHESIVIEWMCKCEC